MYYKWVLKEGGGSTETGSDATNGSEQKIYQTYEAQTRKVTGYSSSITQNGAGDNKTKQSDVSQCYK